MRTLYQLADCGIFKKENLPWKGKRKPNGHSEKRGKQALCSDLRERADSYPNFESKFGHLEGDTIVGKKTQKCSHYLSRTPLKSHHHTENQWTESK